MPFSDIYEKLAALVCIAYNSVAMPLKRAFTTLKRMQFSKIGSNKVVVLREGITILLYFL